MTVQFLFNLEQFSDVNSIILGVVKFYGHSVLGFFVNKGLNYELTFNVKDKVRTIVIDDHDLSKISRLLKSSNNFNFLGCLELDINIESGINCEINTKALYPDLPSKLYLTSIGTRRTKVSNIPGHFQFNACDFNFSNVEIIASVTFEDHISKIQEVLFFDIKVYGAYILRILQLGMLSYLYESKGMQKCSNDCEWKINVAKEQFTNYLSRVENTEINVPTIKVVKQETQKLLPPYSENEAKETLVKTDDQEISKETVINTNTNTNTNTKELNNMLNNNVTLTVQLTDVNNAPKNADGSNKTYSQAGKKNNYRGWVMNYKPETNLITITGTLVTHTDLVCQVNGLKDKYISLKADSLNNQTRVTFCIKAPKGFIPDSENMSSFQEEFQLKFEDYHKKVSTNFDKQLNSFVRIDRASSFVYSAATEETNASLTCFLSFNDLNFFKGKYSLVNKLTSLTRVTKTIALS